jgi:hypothetical protein
MRRTSAVLCLAVVAGVLISAGAWARTIPANMGQARVGSQANLFSYSFSTGAVTASGNADWALGLPTDTDGSKSVLLTVRAAAAGAQCRVVANNRIGTMFAATPFSTLPVQATYSTHIHGVVVPSTGVMFVDCIMNNGASLAAAQYTP